MTRSHPETQRQGNAYSVVWSQQTLKRQKQKQGHYSCSYQHGHVSRVKIFTAQFWLESKRMQSYTVHCSEIQSPVTKRKKRERGGAGQRLLWWARRGPHWWVIEAASKRRAVTTQTSRLVLTPFIPTRNTPWCVFSPYQGPEPGTYPKLTASETSRQTLACKASPFPFRGRED